MDGSGPEGDVILSSRIRLARNVGREPFPHRAAEARRAEVFEDVAEALRATPSLERGDVWNLEELSRAHRRVCVERHLASLHLARGSGPRGVAVAPGEALGAMINEEDHLRIQSVASGLDLRGALERAVRLDRELEELLDFAVSPERGYVTACPTNAGTGLRASVLIHLPALVLLDEIQKVLKSVMQVGLNVRGLYGEHSEVLGNLFQLSNQTTLGRSERDSIESLERVTRQILETEERARERMVRDARVQIEDKIWRAYGTLRYCRSIHSREVINLCSAVRLGVSLGLPGLCPLHVVNELMVLTQPAHLQRLHGAELTPAERNVYRAQLVRERLAAAAPEDEPNSH
jgi:protein arginine kinase